MGKAPSTNAVRALRASGVSYTEHTYAYEEKGGTRVAARCLKLDEHAILKTLVAEDDTGHPLVVLMHGDYEVSMKTLARLIGCRSVHSCDPKVAERHSGYRVGGISPFGMRKPMPVYVQASVLDLPRVFVNGGSRGFLVGLATLDLLRLLQPVSLDVAQRAE